MFTPTEHVDECSVVLCTILKCFFFFFKVYEPYKPRVSILNEHPRTYNYWRTVRPIDLRLYHIINLYLQYIAIRKLLGMFKHSLYFGVLRITLIVLTIRTLVGMKNLNSIIQNVHLSKTFGHFNSLFPNMKCNLQFCSQGFYWNEEMEI